MNCLRSIFPRYRRCIVIAVILTISLGILYFGVCSAADNSKWVGVDEAVVEKLAKEYGREAAKPLIDIEQGDLMLFCFLVAGAIGGFAAGYYWRTLSEERNNKFDVNHG